MFTCFIIKNLKLVLLLVLVSPNIRIEIGLNQVFAIDDAKIEILFIR